MVRLSLCERVLTAGSCSTLAALNTSRRSHPERFACPRVSAPSRSVPWRVLWSHQTTQDRTIPSTTFPVAVRLHGLTHIYWECAVADEVRRSAGGGSRLGETLEMTWQVASSCLSRTGVGGWAACALRRGAATVSCALRGPPRMDVLDRLITGLMPAWAARCAGTGRTDMSPGSEGSVLRLSTPTPRTDVRPHYAGRAPDRATRVAPAHRSTSLATISRCSVSSSDWAATRWV